MTSEGRSALFLLERETVRGELEWIGESAKRIESGNWEQGEGIQSTTC